MEDNEIIKALKCCNSNFAECPKECPMYTTKFNEKTNCIDENNGIMALALDLINRQKAEIERLTAERDVLKGWERLIKAESHAPIIKKAKSEARKEFAKRLCEGRVSNDPVVIAVKAALKERERR